MENQIVKSSGIDFGNENSLVAVQRSCKCLVNSELVPAAYSSAKVGEPKAVANTMIALDMAMRTGANPLMVMQNLHIVQGRPSFSSAFLIATINTSGRYETLKYKKGVYEGGVKDRNGKVIPNLQNMFCYAYTWERGQKFLSEEDKRNNVLTSTIITMQMAVDEGWYEKAGSKWKTMPSQMLMYRAAAFWCRAFAPELSMGMHTTEDLEDGLVEDVDFEDMSAEPQPMAEQKPSVAETLKAKADAMAKASEEFQNEKPTTEQPQELFADGQ